MRHSESEYIDAGFRYEKAGQATGWANRIRAMLDQETPEDQTEARRLIEQGRQEARQWKR